LIDNYGSLGGRQLPTNDLATTWHDPLPVAVPAFSSDQVYAALDPGEAVEAVREAFLEHARGSWAMPSKLYVEAAEGDFRAMPAAGAGHTVLKWVTSFPGNPARGLPTVGGVVLLSDAATGELRALLDAGAVTALRTGAAAVLAAETLSVEAASPAAVIGCGVNGRAVARTFLARGRDVLLWDARPEQAAAVAAELGERASVAREAGKALSAGVVVTVTPGHQPVFRDGDLREGQHVSLMGADGPGKAEITDGELARARIVCDEWEQASHNGDLGHALAAGAIRREDVAELGNVLLGTEEGRRGDEEITIFDSTGLAVQDLAVALAVYRRYQQDPESDVFGDTVNVPIG
jgi:alanine dehydrogenase